MSLPVLDHTNGFPYTGEVTDTYSEGFSLEGALGAAYDELAAAVDWGREDHHYSSERNSHRWDADDFTFFATWARYRLGVPEFYSTEDEPRSYYEVWWDEVQASDDWWDWFDGGKEGEEPAGGPVLVTSRTWSWGGDMGARWSEWFEMAPPTVSEHAIRVANVMVKCWKSQRLGVVPTAHGDLVELGS